MAKNKDNKGKMKSNKQGQQDTATSLVDNSTSTKTDNKSKSNSTR